MMNIEPMPIMVEWANAERTIITWIFSESWTWHDFEMTQTVFHDMLRSVNHTVDVIADLRRSHLLPKDTFAHFKRLERKTMPNRDRVILVTTNHFIKSMAKTFNQIFKNRPTRFLLADTMEDALQILALPRLEPTGQV